MSTYSSRNRSINRRMRADMATQARLQGIAIGALAVCACLAGAAIGYSLPMGKPSSFELVEIHASGESDIVDHGMTAFECAANAAFAHSLQPTAAFECAAEINR